MVVLRALGEEPQREAECDRKLAVKQAGHLMSFCLSVLPLPHFGGKQANKSALLLSL